MTGKRTRTLGRWTVLAIALAAVFGLEQRAATQGPVIGTLTVRVEPAVSFYIDGRLAKATSTELDIRLPPGVHRLRLVSETYADIRRVVQLTANASTALTFALADVAVPKVNGQARPPRDARVADPDLQRAIQFVLEGDFKPAIDSLTAVTRSLSNVPRMQRELALSYLYLGIAQAGLDQLDSATRAMAFARRDPSVAPTPRDFPAIVVRAWNDAETVKLAADADIAPAPEAPAPVESSSSVLEIDFVPALDAEFVSVNEQRTILDVVMSSGGKVCAGYLSFETTEKLVQWSPAEQSCATGFEVPFAEVRSPAAAPRGGLLLQFRSARPPMILMPKPDADLLDPAAEPMALSELPASTKVNMRKAHRRMLEALGRPVSGSIFGLQVDLPVEELVANVGEYNGATVRTRGRFSTTNPSRGPYLLTSERESIVLAPAPATKTLLSSSAAAWKDKELIVSGTFSQESAARTSNRGAVTPRVLSIVVSTIELADAATYRGPARTMTLEQIVKSPPARDELVRVVGRYRGLNLYGDLPLDSRRASGDWVIKDSTFAIWVMDHRPAGDGFTLTQAYSQDMSNWLALTGTIEERRGYLYLHTRDVEISLPPSEGATVAATALQRPRTSAPAEIAFTAPLAGAEEIIADQQFLIRFTKPMDEASFTDRINVRYQNDPATPFNAVAVTYYAERAFSIQIDPGRALDPGKTVEITLLPGIKDVDGQPLTGATGPGLVLRWKVRSGR